jgi:MFS family permease
MPSAHASLLSFGFVQSFVASGILYGWPGLVLILKADGMYAPLCDHPAKIDSNHTDSQTSADGCAAQTAALTDLFNVAQATVTGAMIVNGSLLDRFGPRRVSSLGSSFCALGALLFALLPPPRPEDVVDMSYVAFCIMAFGGSGVHLSWFHVSNLYPERRQTISSIIIAGFVGSGAVFPVYQLLSDATPDNFGRKQIFFLHGVLVACTVPFAWRLWPEAPYAPGDSVRFTRWTLAYEITPAAAMEPKKTQQEQEQVAVVKATADGSIAANPVTATKIVEQSIPECEMDVAQQLRQPSFWCMQTFFCIHFFRYIWLLGTLLEQFEAKESAGETDTDTQAARTYTKITGWALPAAALLQPCIGMLLDRYGFARGFLFVVVCGTVSVACLRTNCAKRTLGVRLTDALVDVSTGITTQGYGALILVDSLQLQILMVRSEQQRDN